MAGGTGVQYYSPKENAIILDLYLTDSRTFPFIIL